MRAPSIPNGGPRRERRTKLRSATCPAGTRGRCFTMVPFPSAQRAAKALAHEALVRQSTDNVCVIVVDLEAHGS